MVSTPAAHRGSMQPPGPGSSAAMASRPARGGLGIPCICGPRPAVLRRGAWGRPGGEYLASGLLVPALRGRLGVVRWVWGMCKSLSLVWRGDLGQPGRIDSETSGFGWP